MKLANKSLCILFSMLVIFNVQAAERKLCRLPVILPSNVPKHKLKRLKKRILNDLSAYNGYQVTFINHRHSYLKEVKQGLILNYDERDKSSELLFVDNRQNPLEGWAWEFDGITKTEFTASLLAYESKFNKDQAEFISKHLSNGRYYSYRNFGLFSKKSNIFKNRKLKKLLKGFKDCDSVTEDDQNPTYPYTSENPRTHKALEILDEARSQGGSAAYRTGYFFGRMLAQ